MGLNLETLIGILVILILLILADGIRRMLRDRGRSLKVRIDPSVRNYQDAPAEERNPELLGGPRVVQRNRAADNQADSEPVAPPVIMEKEDAPATPTTEASQPDLFGEAAVAPSESRPRGSAPKNTAPRPTERREPAPQPARKEILDVIVMHLVANPDVRFPGRTLLQQLLEQGLRFGDMNIFHRHRQTASGNDELLFSVANALEPGTFDIDTMEEQTFRAITFFMKLPGPAKPLESLERMLTSARALAEALDAELRDEQHSVLTPQTIEHLRARVQDFERRQRLADAQ
ncbi:MAG: cell division protein ZipA [Alcanivoracaceae bacterium]|nr:cell division protein ZipA [Alcanivoracaceae bacterium]